MTFCKVLLTLSTSTKGLPVSNSEGEHLHADFDEALFTRQTRMLPKLHNPTQQKHHRLFRFPKVRFLFCKLRYTKNPTILTKRIAMIRPYLFQ